MSIGNFESFSVPGLILPLLRNALSGSRRMGLALGAYYSLGCSLCSEISVEAFSDTMVAALEADTGSA